MTPAQCRAARALLDWNQTTLGEVASLGLSTVVDFERSRREISAAALSAIPSALEAAGVIFMEEGGDGHRRLAKEAGDTLSLLARRVFLQMRDVNILSSLSHVGALLTRIEVACRLDSRKEFRTLERETVRKFCLVPAMPRYY